MTIELHRPLALAAADSAAARLEILADEAERQAVAERLGMISIGELSAAATLERVSGKGRAPRYLLKGQYRCRCVRECVVSLDAFEVVLEEPFEFEFHVMAADESPDTATEIFVTGDEPEVVEGPDLDVGEYLVQAIAETLDPYPRRPGVSQEDYTLPGEISDGDSKKPFANLSQLLSDRRR